jgi:hypothetical protein
MQFIRHLLRLSAMSPDPETLEQYRRRNALQPICRLPPEILVIIFCHAQHKSKPHTNLFFYSYTHEWVRVMRVCRYFRDVAVHAPMLWNVYHADSPKAYRELCLQRSAESILYVYGREETIAEIASHVHRVHTAILDDLTIKFALEAPMPQLRVLEIKANGLWTSKLFGGAGAGLTFLRLMGSNVHLCTDPPRLPNLRRLELMAFQVSPSLETIVALLESTPVLEILSVTYLDFGLPSATLEWPVPIPERIALPHLKALDIGQIALEAATLLRLLPTPSRALNIQLRKSKHCQGVCHAEIYAACAKFAQSVHHPELLQQGTLTFGRWPTKRKFSLGSLDSLPNLEQSGQPRLHLSVNDEPSHSHPLLNSIETLRLHPSYRGYPSIHDFDSIVGTTYVPNLRTVVVDICRPLAELPSLQDWVVGRGGRIERIVFADNFVEAEIDAFMANLRGQGLASLPDVARLPQGT